MRINLIQRDHYMKTFKLLMANMIWICCFLLSLQSMHSQTPGTIYEQASPTTNPMDPNGDGWITSSGAAFVTGNELSQFELPFTEVPQLTDEIPGDLQTGSSCGPSELVSNATNGAAGAYYYISDPDGIPDNGDELIIFRMRIARQSNGAFGYSFLFDTDFKFASADPNAVSGNPGFEIEVIYGSGNNNDVLVENVDGSTNGINLATYDTSSNSQRSDALNTASGCTDDPIFIDFYVPLSDIGITTTQNFRIAVATSSSPSSALGGSASDILGVDGDVIASDDDQFTAAIYASSDIDDDGVYDVDDLDDDNDGILDTDESGGSNPSADADNDGIPDYIDADFAGFIDSNSDGVNDNFDTDLDGTADHLDTDSDNDGCADAIEAAGSFTTSDLDVNSSLGTNVDSDGIPQVNSSSAQQATTAAVTDNTTASGCSAVVTPGDSDGDGVADEDDLDDDNDGILDVDEFDCPSGFIDVGATFSSKANPGTQANLYTYNGTSLDFRYELEGGARWNSGVQTATTSGVSGTYINMQPRRTDVPDGDVAVYTFTFSQTVYNVSFRWGGMDFQDRIDVTATDQGTSTAVTLTDINLGSNLTINGQSAVSSAGAANAPNNSLLISISGPVDEIVIRGGKDNGNTGNSTMQLYEVSYCIAQNSDADGIPDHLDTDSDGDGCPDAVEAAGSFIPTDLDSDNSLGDTSDANGIPQVNNSSAQQSTTSAVTDSAQSSACDADLSLVKTINKGIFKVGTTAIFTLRLKNDGPLDATGVQIRDLLPTGLTYNAGSSTIPANTTYDSGTGIWDLSGLTLSNGQTVTIQIAATVTTTGIKLNTAEIISSDQTDTDSTTNNGN